jgi:hypothetical protein
MRIQMLINVTDRTGSYERGQILDLPKAEAQALIDRGRAVPLDTVVRRGRSPQVLIESTALGEPEETAAEPKPHRKRKAS